MAYKTITENQWRAMHGAPEITLDILARCNRVVSKLCSVFNEPVPRRESGLEVEPTQDANVMAQLRTPFGPARLRFAWAIEEGALAGELHVERLTLDRKGQPEWEAVWGIVIPQNGNPYGGTGTDRLSLLFDKQLGDHLENSIFAAGMSMLYAIADGKQT